MKAEMRTKSAKSLFGRLGVSRQVAIPKKLHDELGLVAGDIIEFERNGHQIILTPKDTIEKGIAEGLEDIRLGRVSGPYNTAKALIHALNSSKQSRKKSKRSA